MNLNRRLSIVILLLGTMLITVSCYKEENQPDQQSNFTPKKKYDVSAMNEIIDRYSKVIAVALEDSDFRALIKKDALIQFDGDYDILVKDFHNQMFINSTDSVKRFLANIVDRNFQLEFKMSGEEFLEKITSVIPNLQIAVPVNCETWNAITFAPNVVPLPVDFDDNKANSIATYNGNWEKTNVSLETDPVIPYVVISISERIDHNGNFKYFDYFCKDNNSATSSTTPTNLVVKYSNNSNELWLEWPDVNDDYGYQIYRQTTGTGLQLIATTATNTNNYIDNSVVANQRYTYTVRSLNSQGQPSGFSSSASWYGSDRTPGDMLKLKLLKFDDNSALRSFESWVRGKPELVLHVYSGVSTDSSKEIRCVDWVSPQPKRSDISGSWWNCNIDVNNWDPELYGQIWTFSWSEEDNTKDYEITLGVSATYKDSSGNYTTGVAPNVKFKITTHSDMGNLRVNFWDDEAKEYDLGSGFRFKF